MREFIVNESSFIYGGFIKSEVCDDVISYFEESPLKQGGECGRGIDPNPVSYTHLTLPTKA